MKAVAASMLLLVACDRDPRLADEPARRAAFVEALAEREQLTDAWSLNSRDDLLFEDGFGGVMMIDPDAPEVAWPDLARSATKIRGAAGRWMYRRAHLRVRGAATMHLALRGKMNLKLVATRPRLDVTLDGVLLASAVVDQDGGFVVGASVPAGTRDDWADLYLDFSSVAEPEKEPGDLRVARLDHLDWSRVTP